MMQILCVKNRAFDESPWEIPEEKKCSFWHVFWGLEEKQSVEAGHAWMEMKKPWLPALWLWPHIGQMTSSGHSLGWGGFPVVFIIRTVEADLLALWMNFMSVLKEFDVYMQMSSHACTEYIKNNV